MKRICFLRAGVVLCVHLQVFFVCLQAQDATVSLLFAGDAMQHMPQVRAARTADGYNFDSCFYLIRDKISAADIAGVNLETTLNGKPYSGFPMFSSPDEIAVGLKNAGFDILFQANNHVADKGRSGLNRTIDVLDSLHIKHTGSFKSPFTRLLFHPLMIVKNGIRIAFLNYTYGTNGIPVPEPNIVNLIDTVTMRNDIIYAKMHKPDIIIAVMHWGEEYRLAPSAEQRRCADFLVRNGVRIIIGHHPHVVQPYEVDRVNDSIRNVVYYSLGNFISNQKDLQAGGGMMAELIIRKKNGKVAIVSCDHSLVWVNKYFANGKNHYILVPDDASPDDRIPGMTPSQWEKMNRYIEDAHVFPKAKAVGNKQPDR